jgi:hypothetical protein
MGSPRSGWPFASDYDEDATSPAGLIAGTPVSHPEFGTGGPHGFLESQGVRMYALQSALNLEKAWLLLSMNPSTGSGGAATATRAGPISSGGRAI